MSGAIRAGRAFIEFFGDKSKLARDLRGIEKDLKRWGAGISGLGASLIGGGAAILGPMAAGIASFAKHGSDLNDLSAKSGVSTDALQTLGYAAEQNGASMDVLAGGMKKMQKTLVDASGGSKEAQKALGDLGLSADDLLSMSPDEQFRTMAEAISRIENPAQRTAAAMKVFGKSGTELLGMMSGGRAGLEELEKEFIGLGLLMSKGDIKAADKLGDSLSVVGLVGKRVANIIGGALAPMAQQFAEKAIAVGTAVITWVDSNRGLIQQVALIGGGLVAAGAALVIVGGGLAGLGVAIGGIVTAATTMISVIGGGIAFLMSPIGLVLVAVVGLGAAFLLLTETGQGILSGIGDVFGQLKTTAVGSWRGIVDAVMAGDLALAGQIATKGLYLAWLQLSGPLKGLWGSWVVFFQNVWDAASTGIASGLLSIFSAVQQAWHGIVGGWMGSLQTLIQFLQGVVESVANITGNNQLLDIARKGLGGAATAAAGIQKGAREGSASTEQDKNSAIGMLNDDLQKRMEGRAQAGIDAQTERQKQIADEQAELTRLQKEAFQKRQDADAEKAKPFVATKTDELGATSDTLKRTSMSVTNSFAAARVGRGGMLDLVAENTKQTAENTKDIAEKLTDNTHDD